MSTLVKEVVIRGSAAAAVLASLAFVLGAGTKWQS